MEERAAVAGRRVTLYTPLPRLTGPEGPRILPAEAGTPTGRSVPVNPRAGVPPSGSVVILPLLINLELRESGNAQVWCIFLFS